MDRYRPARASARLQGATRLDDADLRRRGGRDRPDRGQGERRGRAKSLAAGLRLKDDLYIEEVSYCAGAAATLALGASTSAVRVDFTTGAAASLTAELVKRSCNGLVAIAMPCMTDP